MSRNLTIDPITESVKVSAKEISALFKGMYSEEFVEWAILHKDLYIIFGTIASLYEFWQNLPENKE